MHILEKKIRDAQAAGRCALIPYITAGFPDESAFWSAVAELDACGADIIELGVPFSDPVADGPVVEAAAQRALEGGMTLDRLLRGLESRKGTFSAGLVIMGYLNPFLQYGFARFAREAARAGVQGCIIPDLPHEEDAPYRARLAANGMALIPLVGQNTSAERMRLYAQQSEGYAYVVSVMGTTGGQGALPVQARDTLSRARSVFSVPLALGFGLQNPQQLAHIPAQARPDAVVFGSALLRHIDVGNSPSSFMKIWM